MVNLTHNTSFVNSFIAVIAGTDENQAGCEKVSYTICKVSQELLSCSATHSILGDSDSEAKNRGQKKRMISLSRPLFFVADARLIAE